MPDVVIVTPLDAPHKHCFGAWTTEEKELSATGEVTKYVLQRKCFLCPEIEEAP